MQSVCKAIGYLPRAHRDAVRSFVRAQDPCERTATAFAVAEAIYWLSVEFHRGQWSDLYRAGCALDFHPAPSARECEPEDLGYLLYLDLVIVETE